MITKQKIAFYSPVPGSGCSLVSFAFAKYLASEVKNKVQLVSCDFRYSAFDNHTEPSFCTEGPVTVLLPYINLSKCILCKACAKSCVFGAIKIESSISYITVKADKCRACGACLNTCRYDAINERERLIGVWKKFVLQENLTFFEGQLLAEDFFAIQLLQQVNKLPSSEHPVIIDAHSGLNYPALESLHKADAVVLVVDSSSFSRKFYEEVITILKKYHHQIIGFINYKDGDNTAVESFFIENNIPFTPGFSHLGFLKASVYNNPDLISSSENILALEKLASVILQTLLMSETV